MERKRNGSIPQTNATSHTTTAEYEEASKWNAIFALREFHVCLSRGQTTLARVGHALDHITFNIPKLSLYNLMQMAGQSQCTWHFINNSSRTLLQCLLHIPHHHTSASCLCITASFSIKSSIPIPRSAQPAHFRLRFLPVLSCLSPLLHTTTRISTGKT